MSRDVTAAAPPMPLLDSTTFVTALLAGIAADVTWEVWARLLTPLWVGGPLEIMGPAASSFSGVGAPLVVADDGRLVATTGRAGEAYRFEDGRQIELAPAGSDPVAMPRSGTVAWGTVGDDGKLVAVEVRDLLAGTSETYPASGLATNVRELTPGLVILEATAFDPLSRTVTAVDRRDGRSATFEASAPPGD